MCINLETFILLLFYNTILSYLQCTQHAARLQSITMLNAWESKNRKLHILILNVARIGNF